MNVILKSMHTYLYKGYWNTAKEEANVVYEISLEAKDETKLKEMENANQYKYYNGIP